MDQFTVGTMIADPGLHARIMGTLAEFRAELVMELPDVVVAEETLIDRELRRYSPDAVLVEVAATGQRLPDVIRVIKNRPFPPAVITIHASADSEGILAAFRAGASDCLCLPLDKAALRQVFERAAVERERKRPQQPLGKTVGFLSATGGCGGTVLACHFANELWRTSGQTTLLADFDLMAGMVGFWMQAASDYSVWDVMRVWQRLDLSMWRGLVTTLQPQLDVLSAPAEVVADEPCDPDQLLRVMRFARRHYEWVLADLGSNLTAFSVKLLGELNALFLVSTAEVPVLFQAKRILRKLQALGFPHQQVRLVLNCVRKQHLRPAEVAQVVGWQVDAELPFDAMELEEAQAERRLASRKSELGKRIGQLTTKFLSERLDEPVGSRIQVSGVAQPVKALRKAW